jgi:hypothetical protein
VSFGLSCNPYDTCYSIVLDICDFFPDTRAPVGAARSGEFGPMVAERSMLIWWEVVLDLMQAENVWKTLPPIIGLLKSFFSNVVRCTCSSAAISLLPLLIASLHRELLFGSILAHVYALHLVSSKPASSSDLTAAPLLSPKCFSSFDSPSCYFC